MPTVCRGTTARFFAGCLFVFLSPFVSASVDGEWTFDVEVMGQGGQATVVMEEAEDGTLTGSYSGQLGQTPIEGKREGESFHFALQGGQAEVMYEGEVKEDGTLEGTVDLGGMAEGTFTAKKAE